MAVYGYSVQIYCDFSGYTDIAIGVALLLGFKLPVNFNSPYKAVNIADFWRRWHISLSSWLRDYLYIPLGGNSRGSIRTNANLLVTMILGGLWHGASTRIHHLGRITRSGSGWFINCGLITFVEENGYRATRICPEQDFCQYLSLSSSSHLHGCFSGQKAQLRLKAMLNRIWYAFGAEYVPQILNGYWNVFSLMIFALA
jgi:hypothetical protein